MTPPLSVVRMTVLFAVIGMMTQSGLAQSNQLELILAPGVRNPINCSSQRPSGLTGLDAMFGVRAVTLKAQSISTMREPSNHGTSGISILRTTLI